MKNNQIIQQNKSGLTRDLHKMSGLFMIIEKTIILKQWNIVYAYNVVFGLDHHIRFATVIILPLHGQVVDRAEVQGLITNILQWTGSRHISPIFIGRPQQELDLKITKLIFIQRITK